MKKHLNAFICFITVALGYWACRYFLPIIDEWELSLEGSVTLNILQKVPYILLGLSALWAKKIANTPVYLLSLIGIPLYYYMSGGEVLGTGGQILRDVSFIFFPFYISISFIISHKKISCTLLNGSMATIAGIIIPPIVTKHFGQDLIVLIGKNKFFAGDILGVPPGPVLLYILTLGLLLLIPIAGREGCMKKILAITTATFFMFGIWKTSIVGGVWWELKSISVTVSILYGVSTALIILYSNFYLSWGKAYVDDLTQVLGRRALNEAMQQIKGDYSIAMVDIDHFKKFNDKYGHAAGDVVLREVAQMLNNKCEGRVYRYGGEEFSVLYPNKKSEQAAEMMNRVRETLANTKISLNGSSKNGNGKKATVHISVGVSEKNGKYKNVKEVIAAADKALYKAKKNGRNRVEFS